MIDEQTVKRFLLSQKIASVLAGATVLTPMLEDLDLEPSPTAWRHVAEAAVITLLAHDAGTRVGDPMRPVAKLALAAPAPKQRAPKVAAAGGGGRRTCPQCGKATPTERGLAVHMALMHKGKPAPDAGS